jgi:predicted aconitase with swiveling domain
LANPTLLAHRGACGSRRRGGGALLSWPQGDHPHDVAPAPDGTVLYTGQPKGVLGNLDPTTGVVTRIALGQGSDPPGVIVGPDGAPWITDAGLSAIVRVDPATKAVQAWTLPKARANAKLNTAAFDASGRIWFTGQSGIYGRLDPTTGKMTVWDAPKGIGPYGITATPDGQIYYASLAASFLGKPDLETGATSVIEPKTAGVGTRRVWSDPNPHLSCIDSVRLRGAFARRRKLRDGVRRLPVWCFARRRSIRSSALFRHWEARALTKEEARRRPHAGLLPLLDMIGRQHRVRARGERGASVAATYWKTAERCIWFRTMGPAEGAAASASGFRPCACCSTGLSVRQKNSQILG